MRIPSYVRRLPRQPVLPSPTLMSQDVKKALTELLQNQATIMNEIAELKNTMVWLNGQIFETISEVVPSADQKGDVFSSFVKVNASLTQALSD